MKSKSLDFNQIEDIINNLPITEKAWQVKLSDIDEGYLYADAICRADTRNKAKSKLLGKYEVRDMVNRWTNDTVNYTSLPVIRCKEADKVFYNGESLTRHKVRDVIKMDEHNKQLDLILNDKSVQYCYIKKHGSYYQRNMGGYTSYSIHAGVYTKEVAVSHAKNIIEISIIPIDIDKHDKDINDAINDLKINLIQK